MDQHTLKIPYLSRYFSFGDLSEKTKHIWIICHGYGQLSQYFINKFEILDPNKNYVLAPEGTSRFYLKGYRGRVGATWMTKEERQIDIENYIQQLNTLYRSIPQNILSNCQVHLLGFSQGTATVSRWLMNSTIAIDNLVIWAGKIAHEIEFSDLAKRIKNAQCFLVLGTEDEFYNEELLNQYKMEIIDAGIDVKMILFKGKHNLDEATILALESQFEQVE